MVIEERITSQLRLVYEEGFNEETGKPFYKTRSLNNVRPEATPAQLLTVAYAIESLQTLELDSVERRDDSEIFRG